MSKSSEALESLISTHINIQNGTNMIFNTSKILEELNLIKQDLERLEELEKENLELKEEYENLDRSFNSCHLDYENLKGENEQLEKENEDLKVFVDAYANARDELLIRNQKLEKALDKACEMLNWECPVSQNLIDDLDCENRCSDDFQECCKECWKLYFLKEALK